LRKKGLNRQIKTEKKVTPSTFSNSEMFSKGFYRLQEEKNSSSLIQRLEISCQIDSLATNPYRKELDILGISLKVGLAGESKYIVKNIYRFLQIYQDEKMYNGIKQGNVYLHPDAFTLEENELLHHLSNNAQTQQLL